MRVLRAFAARVSGLFTGRRADAELREELESHLAMHVDENLRRGMNPEAARREALVAAGGLTVAAEAVRERRGLPWIEALMTDLRYAMRTLRLNRGYAVAVIVTLALGIGANAAMFTIINAVVLRPLPYAEPDRVVSISLKDKDADRGVVDEHTYAEWARSARSVSVALGGGTSAVLSLAGGPEEVDGRLAAANYFDVLGVRPTIGRTFTADEDRPGGPAVIILSEQLWRRAFAADSAIVGKTVVVDGKPTTIIGVTAASLSITHSWQYWLPFRFAPSSRGSTRYYGVIGRLQHGASIEAAHAELDGLTRRVAAERPESQRDLAPVVMTLQERRYGAARHPLLLLFAAVGVLLLIACANLANLSLARATRRGREFAVRIALGASRGRLIHQVLCESVLLSVVGAGLGLALSTAAVRYFSHLSPKSVGNVEHIQLDGTVLAFTLVIAIATGVLFGLVPALAVGRGALHDALSSGSLRAVGSRRQQWVRRVLVVSQLATALVMVTGAGLVSRTFWRVTSIDPGFRADHLLVAEITLSRSRYTPVTAAPFFEELIARTRGEPGVQRAAYADVTPVGGLTMSVSSQDKEGRPSAMLDVVAVGPGFLETIGARLVEGRFITPDDREGAPNAVVINETAARVFFPKGAPIGQALPMHGYTVVGVVKDMRQRELEAAPTNVGYIATAQDGGRTRARLVIRTSGSPEALEDVVRRAVQSLDPAQVTPTFYTMETKLAEAVAPRRFVFVLLGLFALLAGSLAAVGLYGVLAYLVAERTREIGIRVALGADARRVRRLVIGQGMALTVVGVAIGLGGSIAAVRTLRTMMYEVSVYDIRTFAAAAALLAAVAYLASYLPARRASRVDPMIALRAE